MEVKNSLGVITFSSAWKKIVSLPTMNAQAAERREESGKQEQRKNRA